MTVSTAAAILPKMPWAASGARMMNICIRRVFDNIDENKPSFNIILNTSNHSPFNIDLAAKGFDAEAVKNALPENERNNQELIKELGHFWYADKAAGEFIAKVKAKYPDSLFVFVGDHADRYNIDKVPSMYERYTVPLIITAEA